MKAHQWDFIEILMSRLEGGSHLERADHGILILMLVSFTRPEWVQYLGESLQGFVVSRARSLSTHVVRFGLVVNCFGVPAVICPPIWIQSSDRRVAGENEDNITKQTGKHKTNVHCSWSDYRSALRKPATAMTQWPMTHTKTMLGWGDFISRGGEEMSSQRHEQKTSFLSWKIGVSWCISPTGYRFTLV